MTSCRIPRPLSALAFCAAVFTACSGDPGADRRSGMQPMDPGMVVSGTGGIGGGVGGSGGAVGGTGGTQAVVAGTGGQAGTGPIGVTPIAIDQCDAANPAGLSDADLQRLLAGGSPAGMRYLYPYDETVFPRGLIAPTLMWEGSDAATAVYVHIVSGTFDYRGCLVPTGPGRLDLPGDVWSQAEAQTLGPSDPFSIELTTLEGSTVKGPIAIGVVIAQATFKGSIFYNSYASKLSSGTGAVLRVVPGNDVELFVGGPAAGCTGCHAMSADGSRLVSFNLITANAYALDPSTPPNPPALSANGGASFVGVAPDGTVYLTNASGAGLGVRAGATGTARLYETDTGVEITGHGIPTGAAMGTFSADGTLLAFNDLTSNPGHVLAVMDYDPAGRKASNYRAIYTSPDAMFPSWPFVLPDNGAVIFERGAAADFSGGNVGISLDNLLGGLISIPPPTVGPYGNLFVVDLASGTPVMLAKAMGYATEADAQSGASYLPYATDERDMNYYPTVSPAAAGGYFWVFFDSMRHYGNQGLYRQLWGTAVTVSADGTYTSDPSHPAFYLTGQEFGTGNHRAFAALDPCRADGEACTSGIDCCGGFCTDGVCGIPEQPRCSNTDETCETRADCCNAADYCIAGRCAQVVVE